MNRRIQSTSHLRGEISVPGDKSISNRAIMLGAIAAGDTRIYNLLEIEDCMTTIISLETYGMNIMQIHDQKTVLVHGESMI